MSEIFKSDGSVADNDSSRISAQSGAVAQAKAAGSTLTNLTVLGNLQETLGQININNSAYKELLSKDAAAISQVKEEYDKFDQEICTCMGIE